VLPDSVGVVAETLVPTVLSSTRVAVLLVSTPP
jgi:hypothetical protein